MTKGTRREKIFSIELIEIKGKEVSCPYQVHIDGKEYGRYETKEQAYRGLVRAVASCNF